MVSRGGRVGGVVEQHRIGDPSVEGTAMASTASKNKSSSSDASAESNTWNGRRDVVNIIFCQSLLVVLFVHKVLRLIQRKSNAMCVCVQLVHRLKFVKQVCFCCVCL